MRSWNAGAQSQAAASAAAANAQSDAVIISATRFPEDARRLPASVTVLGAADVQRSAARTLPELLAEQAGLTMKDFSGNNAALHGYDAEGYRENNRNQQKNASLNLRWGPGESCLDLRAGSDRQELRLPGARKVQPSLGLDEHASDPRGAQTPLDWSNRDGERIGATWVTRLGAAELNLGADWRGKKQQAYFEQSGFPTYRDDELGYTVLTPRVRVPFELGGFAHRLTLEADWIRWRYDSRRSDRPENAGQPINRVRIDRDMQALYVQDRVELSPASRLTLGWREERVEYRATDSYDPGAGFGSEAPAAAARQREHAWELGLRHALSGALAAFARAGRSFRFVGADEVYENDAAFSAQFQILRPQTALTYEAKAKWSTRAARRRGVELDGAWRFGASVHLFGAYDYTDARFREGVLAGSGFAIGTNLDIAGKRAPLVPEHKLNLGISWDIDARARLSGSLTALSDQFMDNDGPNTLGTKIPAYGMVDVKLARDLGWGRVAFAVNNLFDERYYTYAVRSQFTADRYAVYPLPGRTVSLSAELRVD